MTSLPLSPTSIQSAVRIRAVPVGEISGEDRVSGGFRCLRLAWLAAADRIAVSSEMRSSWKATFFSLSLLFRVEGSMVGVLEVDLESLEGVTCSPPSGSGR